MTSSLAYSDNRPVVANESREHVEKWLDRYLKRVRCAIERNEKYDAFQVIAGKVGIGKTTFIQYLSKGFLSVFLKNQYIPLTLYYEDWKIENWKLLDEAKFDWDEYLDKLILRKLLEKISSLENIRNMAQSDEFRDSFIESRSIDISIDIEKDMLQNGINDETIHKMAVRDYNALMHLLKSFSESRYSRLNEQIPLTLAQYLRYKQILLIIIIDGLDQLSIGGITEGKYKNIFSAVANKALNAPHHRNEPNFKYTFLLTFRFCTFDAFKNKSRCDRQMSVTPYPLIPSNLDCVIRNAIESLPHISHNERYSLFKDDIHAYICSMTKKITESLGFKDTHELCSSFNFNNRKLLQYCIEIHKQLCSYAMKNEVLPEDYSDLFKLLIETLNRNTIKQYEFIETLILREKIYFQNYYRYERGITFSFDSIMHKDTMRAFVDNIFNYTLHAAKDTIPPLLINIRILQFLSRQGYQTEEQIENVLKSLGYDCDISSVLKHYCGSAFLKLRSQDQKYDPDTGCPVPVYIYNITGLGKYVLSSLVVNPVYIEYVLHSSLFPKVVNDHLHGMYRSIIPDWVKWSLINMFVVYNYIWFIEDMEAKKQEVLKEYFPANWRLTNRLLENLKSSMKRVTPEYGVNFDLDFVIHTINSYLDDWKRKNMLVKGDLV